MLVLFLAAVVGATGAQGAPGKVRPPVVVLVLDEFPTTSLINQSGDISAARFPNFARLSREASWYPNHTTVSNRTFGAVPAIMTGKYAPAKETLPEFSLYPRNIFSWMKSAGYRIRAEETATQICSPKICRLTSGKRLPPRRFKSPRDFLKAKVAMNLTRSRRTALTRAGQVKIRPGELIFRHLLIPHHPYLFLPSGQLYGKGPIPNSPWGKRAPIGNARLGYQRMMLQVGYADRIIGALRRNAIRQGRWKSMMLVIVGDHGIEHRPDSHWRELDRKNLGSLAFTPLFVKYPGSIRGGKSPLATQGIDVAPTIAQATGTRYPAVDGVPIPDLGPDPRPVRIEATKFPFQRALASRNQAIDYRDGLLGSGGLFQMGPSADLIGRPARALRTRSARAVLDSPAAYRSVKPGSSTVPAMVTGTVTGISPGRIVAVSLNGVIRGTAQVFRDGKALRFGAMINPRHLRKSNRIVIYPAP